MTKVLSIVESAYRGTIEEQDDTILWFNHFLKNAGADITILLQSNAVNYAAKGQDATGLRFGNLAQTHPPEIDKDLSELMGKSVPVYMVKEDADDRGLVDPDLLKGVEKIARNDLPKFLDQFDHVWHW